jgi:NTP pyrophosphatase (non-canonical NTP hydrolase)
MHLDNLAFEIHDNACEKGFWVTDPDINFMLAKLALVHSEVSETLEALRKQQGHSVVEEELADVLIRLLDFVEGAKRSRWADPNSSFDEVVRKKIDKNKMRAKKHGNLI